MKTCSKCKRELPDEEFIWDDRILQGMAGRCLDCRAERRCPDCIAVRPKRKKCERHRIAHRKPGLPPERFHIRTHAQVRFWQRVRPDLMHQGQVIEEMLRLAYEAPHTDDPPDFYTEICRPWWSRGYLIIDADTCFSLSWYRDKGTEISTVLTRAEARRPVPREDTPAWVMQIEDGFRRRIERKRARQERLSKEMPA